MKFLLSLWIPIDKACRRVLIFFVHLYQKYLSWMLGNTCRFVPSCSQYAEEALFRGPLFPALWLIIYRLARCQPLCKGGIDPIGEKLNNPAFYLGEISEI